MNFHLWIKDVNPKIVLDQKYKSGRGGLKAILDKATDMYKGSLFNYVDQNLPIIDHPPTPSWHWWRNSITGIRKNTYTIGNF